MADLSQIRKYASEWYSVFADPRTRPDAIIRAPMFQEGADLGFEMDCGHAFEAKYPGAFRDLAVLVSVIETVTDIPLLCSAIHSQRRYYDHWAYSTDEILEPENRAWFIVSLRRLAILAGADPRSLEDSFHFQGALRRIRLTSDRIFSGRKPQPDDEVRQTLAIIRDGRVWFSSYRYGEGKPELVRNGRFRISPNEAKMIMDAFLAVFTCGYCEPLITDAGVWHLDMQNRADKCYSFEGSLGSSPKIHADLSSLVRKTLSMNGLLVMDGGSGH